MCKKEREQDAETEGEALELYNGDVTLRGYVSQLFPPDLCDFQGLDYTYINEKKGFVLAFLIFFTGDTKYHALFLSYS